MAAKTKKKMATTAPDDDEREATGGRRPVWKGSISFGLIDIPVTLLPAEKREALHFSMLDKRDLSPIRYERVSAKSGKPVPWEQVVKGYEFEKGEYVVMSEPELKAANPEATQTVEILAFVDASEVPPEFFDRPYFLEPQKRGRKGYALLRDVLKKTSRVGVARVVIKTRQYLALVMPRGEILALELLRWADEVRDASEVHLGGMSAKSLGITAKELEMAGKLVDGMVETWRPEQYRDAYRDDVMKLIRKKVKSGKLTAIEEPEEEAKPEKLPEVVDFMSLLKKSLDEKTKAGVRSAARRKTTRKAGRGAKAARSA